MSMKVAPSPEATMDGAAHSKVKLQRNSEVDTGMGTNDVLYEGAAMCIRRVTFPVHECREDENGMGSTERQNDPGTTNAREGETRAISIKALSNPKSPSMDDQVRLSNEYNILTRMQQRQPRPSDEVKAHSGIRYAVGRVPSSGRIDSIHLEYVPGVSLKDWINSQHENVDRGKGQLKREDILCRVQVARGVSCALAEVHDAGVVHNDVTPSSFIVDLGTEKPDACFCDADDVSSDECSTAQEDSSELSFSKSCRVKIISFGYAAFKENLEADDCGERASDDMPALGAVIRKIFSESDNDDDNNEDEDEFGGNLGFGIACDVGLGGSSKHCSNLLPNLPRSICILLNNLTEINADDPYKSAREVEQDLEQMLEDPNSFLFDPEPGDELDILRFSQTKLYGRSTESTSLRDSCDRFLTDSRRDFSDDNSYSNSLGSLSCNSAFSVGEPKEIVLVSGKAGIGKSELVRRVCRPWAQRENGYFIQGKFDQIRRGQPYSALAHAFTDLCESILDRGESTVQSMSIKIKEAVGELGGVITDVVPSLVKIIGEQPAVPQGVTGAQAKNRFEYLFRKFVRAVSKPEHPVILFIDDLQWVDEASLQLIRVLVTSSSIMLVGSYRDDEVDENHPLALQLREIKNSGAPMIKIDLGDLNAVALNDLVSDALRMPRRLTRTLADVVHRKTNGNTFFAVQFLRSLTDEGLLVYETKSYRWRWDNDELCARNISDDVVDLFSAKIRKLPSTTQSVLKMAAGFGSSFYESTLRLMVLDHVNQDTGTVSGRRLTVCFEQEIAALERDGLIMKMDSGAQVRYGFPHDRIQEVAYSLIAQEDRSSLHARIGKILHKNAMDNDQMDRWLFVIADQLNRGSSLLSEAERIELVTLNLHAGENAIKTSAFVPAVSYLKRGLELLREEEKFSTDHYFVTLRLCTAVADAECVNGNFDETECAAKHIFSNAACLLDKFPAYMSLVKSLISQGRLQEAISSGFDVLSQLGETFPKAAGTGTIIKDMMRTKMKLRGKTNDKLSQLPAMKDENKIAAMRMLSLMVSCCIVAKQEYIGLVTFRLVRLSLKYGLSDESAFGFASYGMILCGIVGDLKEGYRFGQLALKIQEKFDAKQWLARVYGLVYYFIVPWRDTLCTTLDHFMYASEVAFEVGDLEYACYQVLNYTGHAFQCGRPLAPLQVEITEFNRLMITHSQDVPRAIILPFHQCVLNLIGQSDDPLHLTGVAMNEELFVKEATDMGNLLAVHTVFFCRLLLAYMLGEYKLAAEMADNSRDIVAKVAPGLFMVANHAFYDGMTACALVRESKSNKKKWTKVKANAIKKMKKWSRHAPENCSHKLLLLQAEDASLKGKSKAAHKAYDAAIAAARSSGVTQDEALACERAGAFFEKVSDKHMASRCFAKAHQLYLDWGADTKADQLQRQHSAQIKQAKQRGSFNEFMKVRSTRHVRQSNDE